MLDSAFCDLLEYRLRDAFQNSPDEEVNHYWCDGILLPTFDYEYSQKYVNDHRHITLSGFIGPDGQDKYNIDLFFGKKALSKYARGMDISDCIPSFPDNGCFQIETSKKRLLIQLL